MQRKTDQASSEPRLTLPDLSQTNEAALLTFAIGFYAILHPNECPDTAIAQKIGKSHSTFSQAKGGNGSIGLDGWAAMEEILGVELAQMYIKKRRGL